jgi:hypothetical protein
MQGSEVKEVLEIEFAKGQAEFERDVVIMATYDKWLEDTLVCRIIKQ